MLTKTKSDFVLLKRYIYTHVFYDKILPILFVVRPADGSHYTRKTIKVARFSRFAKKSTKKLCSVAPET